MPLTVDLVYYVRDSGIVELISYYLLLVVSYPQLYIAIVPSGLNVGATWPFSYR